MKKIKMMRVASVLLIAVMLSTCVISGTFAKYVTSDSTEDHARVAKFGVVVRANGSLFDKSYFWVNDGNLPFSDYRTEEQDGDEPYMITVKSSTEDNVVAPGTQSPRDGLTISVTGTPEVDVRVTLDLTVDNDVYLLEGTYPDMTTGDSTDTFTFAGYDYYPVKYTLTRNGDAVVTDGTIADVKAKLDEIVKGDKEYYYDANTDLGDKIGVLNLTWKWDFDPDPAKITEDAKTEWAANSEALEATYGDEDAYIAARIADATKLQDQQDTLLGDLAAGVATDVVPTTSYNLTTGISISITVTQVD